MYSHQISDILNNDEYARKTFIGVFSADELNTLKPPRKRRFGLVVNTDPSNQPGRHWQSIFIDKGECNFFCSLDEQPTPDILKFMRKYRRVTCNRNRQQKLSEVTCGGYCVFIQAMMARGYSFKTLCTIFDQIENDDDFIRTYLKDTYNF